LLSIADANACRSDHAGDPARRHTQTGHGDREQVQHPVPVIGHLREGAPAEGRLYVPVVGAQVAATRSVVDLKPGDERFGRCTEVRLARRGVVGERLVAGARLSTVSLSCAS
jgi:hypothetical protein